MSTTRHPSVPSVPAIPSSRRFPSASLRAALLLLLTAAAALVCLPAVRAQNDVVDASFKMPVFTSNVLASRVYAQPDGRFYVYSGYTNPFIGFDRVNGEQRGDLLRYNADGTLDTTFKLDPSLYGKSISAVSYSKKKKRLVVATDTTGVGAAVYRLNKDGSIDPTFATGAPADTVFRSILAQPDGKVLAGGLADYGGTLTYAGFTFTGLLRLNDDGTVDTGFQPVLNNVQGNTFYTTFSQGTTTPDNIRLQPDGKILITGSFSKVNGVDRPSVARLNADGTLDTSFNPTGFSAPVSSNSPGNGNNAVRASAIQSTGKVLISSKFDSSSYGYATGLIRLNTDGSLDTSFKAPASSYGSGFSIAVDGSDNIYVSNNGALFGKYDADGTADEAYNANLPEFQYEFAGLKYAQAASAAVLSLLADGRLAIAGGFVTAGGSAVPGVAVLRTDGTLDPSFAPGSYQADAPPAQIAVRPDGTILVAGAFDTVSGQSRAGLALLYADGSLSPKVLPGGFLADPNYGSPQFLTQNDGKVLLYGYLPSDEDGNQAFNYLRLNVDLTVDPTLTVDPDVTGFTSVLARPEGGYLVSQGSADSTSYLEKLNQFGGFPAPFSLEQLDASGTSQGDLAIAGDFSSFIMGPYNGQPGSLTGILNQITVSSGDSRALVIQPDGKTIYKFFSNDVFQLLRLNADGTTDTGFQPGSVPPQGTSQGFSSLVNLGAGSEQAHVISPNDTAINGVFLQADGKLLVYGSFTKYNNTTAGGLVRLNADGTVDTAFNAGTGPKSNGAVDKYNPPGIIDLRPLPGGKLLLVGNFDTFNGKASPGLARLDASGTVDTTFVSPVTSNAQTTIGITGQGAADVLAEDLAGNFLLVGNYTTVAGSADGGLIRLIDPSTTAPGSVLPGFDPGAGADGEVRAIVFQPDGRALIGGSFTTYRGAARAGVARVNTDGTLDTSFDPGTGADGPVNAILLQADGRIIIGGDFSLYDGIERNGLARLEADGTLDRGFDAGLSGDASASDAKRRAAGGAHPSPRGDGRNGFVSSLVARPTGGFTAGGVFKKVHGQDSNSVAQLDDNGNADANFHLASGPDGPVYATVTQPDGKSIIAGDFARVEGAARAGIARLNTDGTLDTTFDPGTGATGGAVNSLALQPDGSVVLGGDFTAVRDVPRPRVARLRGDGGLDGAFDPGSGADATVRTVVLQPDGDVLVGGDFKHFGGEDRGSVARVKGDGSVDKEFAARDNARGGVRAIAVRPDGNALVGGDFTAINDVAVGRLALLGTGLQAASAAVSPVNVSVDLPQISRAAGQFATVTFTRTGDTSAKIKVFYSVAGNLANGGDFVFLKGSFSLKPGKDSKSIKVVPTPEGATGKVKIIIQQGDGYSRGSQFKAKVKIVD